jgi:hypothetical protein
VISGARDVLSSGPWRKATIMHYVHLLPMHLSRPPCIAINIPADCGTFPLVEMHGVVVTSILSACRHS